MAKPKNRWLFCFIRGTRRLFLHAAPGVLAVGINIWPGRFGVYVQFPAPVDVFDK